ncbi:MAG: hypothetical protein KAT05_13855 [Spirochaetes bacterium]|nr:hypothetical protein [Spirochaetota bacterium]
MKSKYIRCECCGKYFLESEAKNKKQFCSTVCEEQLIRCIVCGNYYKLEDYFDRENYICSKECTKKYKFKSKRDKTKLDFSGLQ